MRTFRSATIFALLSAAVASQATIIVLTGPGSFPDDENILFNEPGLIGTGPIVEGITNQTSSIVLFSDANEDLTTPSGGQARIEAVDGGLTDMRISLENPSLGFSTLIWNLNASANGTVTFTVERTGGADLDFTFDLDGPGENFFRFEAIDEMMTSVTLQSSVDLQDVRQIRVGIVPEPASLAALGIGALALLKKRRRLNA